MKGLVMEALDAMMKQIREGDFTGWNVRNLRKQKDWTEFSLEVDGEAFAKTFEFANDGKTEVWKEVWKMNSVIMNPQKRKKSGGRKS